jgi:hypothetical protein
MTTQSLQSFFDQWADLNARAERVRKDDSLSMLGKRRAFDQIEGARALVRDNAVEAFIQEYDRQARAMAANNRLRSQALENSLARFETLQFAIEQETKRVQEMLTSGKSLAEMKKAWADVRYSAALVVAWRNALLGAPSTMQPLQVEVRNEYDQVRMTPELQRVNAAAGKLADAVLELQKDTVVFMELLTKAGDRSPAGATLQNLMQRIKPPVYQPTGGWIVDIVDSPAEELDNLQEKTFIIGG